jgi:hypothetical protein
MPKRHPWIAASFVLILSLVFVIPAAAQPVEVDGLQPGGCADVRVTRGNGSFDGDVCLNADATRITLTGSYILASDEYFLRSSGVVTAQRQGIRLEEVLISSIMVEVSGTGLPTGRDQVERIIRARRLDGAATMFVQTSLQSGADLVQSLTVNGGSGNDRIETQRSQVDGLAAGNCVTIDWGDGAAEALIGAGAGAGTVYAISGQVCLSANNQLSYLGTTTVSKGQLNIQASGMLQQTGPQQSTVSNILVSLLLPAVQACQGELRPQPRMLCGPSIDAVATRFVRTVTHWVSEECIS